MYIYTSFRPGVPVQLETEQFFIVLYIPVITAFNRAIFCLSVMNSLNMPRKTGFTYAEMSWNKFGHLEFDFPA